ncbi:MAG: hypothetical protein H6736_05410 [Alphaproteobacteria bacterium]|nr:hypothetical protein [Alphaproteobacteria bacterium]MCB9691236.1 hypothetical protein [Alphaproteobacteria bacterium]
MTRIAPVLLLTLAACTPHSATLTDARLVGWLGQETSFTLYQDYVDFSDPGFTDTWTIDCRLLEEADEGLRIEGGLDICDDGSRFGEFAEGETWLNTAAWQGFAMDLDKPWRAEAIYTTEGDLHVGFHHRIPGSNQDFRFFFVIDPDFSPTECVGTGDNVTAQPIDGTPWVDAWSDVWADLGNQDLPPFLTAAVNDFPDGRLHLLNARSYQLDQDNLNNPNLNRWTLPEDWASGFAHGTFTVEDMHSRPSFFAPAFAYLAVDSDDFSNWPDPSDVWYGNPGPQAAAAEQHALWATQDMNHALPSGVTIDYRPIHIDNAWREIDGEPGGLDAWQQLDYSWVVISSDSDPTPGGEVRGAFSILMDPDDSSSRWVVQGRFEVPRVRKEKWGGVDLRAKTAEANGLNLCLAGSPTDDGTPEQ